MRKSNVSYKSISHLPNEEEIKELKLFVGEKQTNFIATIIILYILIVFAWFTIERIV